MERNEILEWVVDFLEDEAGEREDGEDLPITPETIHWVVNAEFQIIAGKKSSSFFGNDSLNILNKLKHTNHATDKT